ncbi:hypothetical protein O3M35_002213 [Rhynocoris fuscipes]
MLLTFRVSELQMLLGFAGQNKTGRKTELQARALELLTKSSSTHARQIHTKIRELYKSIQQGGTVMQGAAPGVTPTSLEMSLENRNSVLSPTMSPMPRTMATAPPPPPSASQMSFIPMSTRSNNTSNIYSSLYSYPPKLPQIQPPPPPVYPVQPDVRFKRLPFYEIMGELLKPSSLVPVSTQREQSTTFVFYLTPQQATDVAMNREVGPNTKNEYNVQIQLRFCLLETSCEQEDLFPPGIVVKVNGKLCPLPNPIPINRPNVEPKRPPRPVNISSWCKLCPSVANQVAVSWTPEYGRGYVISVNLVKKLTANDLLIKMKAKGSRHADYTTGLIKEKLCEDADSEIATTSLRVSLLCPLGKMRMTTPCRPSTCTHLQCFDASLFLQMNEKKPTWACPVCDKPAIFDNLVIDGYFQQVLASPLLPQDCHEIQLHKDGTWTGQAAKKATTTIGTPTKQDDVAEIIDDLDENSQPEIKADEDSVKKEDDCSEESCSAPASKTAGKVIYTVDLTFSDSEDEGPTTAATPTVNGGASSARPSSDTASSNSAQDTSDVTESRPTVVNGQISDSSSSNSGGRNSSSPSCIITLDSPSPPPRITTPPTFDQAFMDLTNLANPGSESGGTTSPSVICATTPPSTVTTTTGGNVVTPAIVSDQPVPSPPVASPSPSASITLPGLPLVGDAPTSGNGTTPPPTAGTSSPLYHHPGPPTPHSPYITSYARLPQGTRYQPY